MRHKVLNFLMHKGPSVNIRKYILKPRRIKTPAWAWFLVVAAAALLVYFLIPQGYANSQKLKRELSPAEVMALREGGAFIVDVREQSEWEQGHIEGAALIPLGQLLQRSGELPTDRTIVVVCRSGNRSAQGRDILETAGFKTVSSMRGGMKAWQAQGYPVVTGP